MRIVAVVTCATFIAVAPSCDADQRHRLVPSAPERWSAEGKGGVPEFRRHVVPLFSKLGCNMRNCHGSFQGQAGFRLSLFGFEPDSDHAELLEASQGGPRVDLEFPQESLVLLKPTLEESHKGGKRIESASWQYELFKKWIAEGASPDSEKAAQLTRFEVRPGALVLANAGETGSLRTVAYFDDGTKEDVTGLTVFSSNDDAVADVAADGTVTAKRPGGTAIIAQYAGGVASTQLMIPAPDDGVRFPDYPPHNEIDTLVVQRLRKLNVRPSRLCSDSEFVRRVYLDLIGTLPTPAEVRNFLADADPAKRALLVDRLLERPEYPMYWGMKFSDWTGNSKYISRNPLQWNWMWQQWIEDKLSRNVPYDEFVYGFLCATSLEGRERAEYLEELAEIVHQSSGRYNYDGGTYAKRKTNVLYWINVERRKPEDMVLQTANSFLGIRLECAQCHNHPFDRWTQRDFESFKSFFMLVRYCDPKTGKEIRGGGRGFDAEDVQAGVLRRYASSVQKHPPKLLGGPELHYQEGGVDLRVALWEWMRDPANRYFAPALVNRFWEHYFGIGIVDPADDFNLGNPPSNPPLLRWLASEFIRHRFDLKHLHRVILNSRTYQLSWRPNPSNRLDRNFSRARLRRLPAEVMMDAIAQATGVPYDFGRLPEGRPQRAVGQAAPPVRYSINRSGYPMQIFGRPAREKTCDCERSNEPSVAQALYLINDREITAKLQDPNGRLPKLLKVVGDDREVIEELYLAALARRPTDEELQIQTDHVEAARSREAGMRDVLWSLLNMREFIFNH